MNQVSKEHLLLWLGMISPDEFLTLIRVIF